MSHDAPVKDKLTFLHPLAAKDVCCLGFFLDIVPAIPVLAACKDTRQGCRADQRSACS